MLKMLRRFGALIAIALVLACVAPAAVAESDSSGPVWFHGEIEQFWEYWAGGYVVANFTASVETNTGDTYTLDYQGLEVPADPPSDWRNFVTAIEASTWQFGDADHTLVAAGKVRGTQLLVFPPGLPAGTPTVARIVGTLGITDGSWGGDAVIGGSASYNMTVEKSEFWNKAFCSDSENPCEAQGKVSGVFHLTSD